MSSDPLDALKWAMNHSDAGWWVVGLVAAGIAWTTKRLREWSRRNALATGPKMAATPSMMQWTPGTPSASAPSPARPAPPAASSYAAAPSYAAAGYIAQPAYAAPAKTAPPPAPSRKLHRESAPAQRGVTPVARSVEVPRATPTGRWTLAGAFGDPAHARTAIVVAEVLGPPLGLR
ncbi:MAG TPA: hypothetical protein VN224_14985 [Xanthomonadales bacterium]|nr:hypothetical protein [Xanthomonadales bacterium]